MIAISSSLSSSSSYQEASIRQDREARPVCSLASRELECADFVERLARRAQLEEEVKEEDDARRNKSNCELEFCSKRETMLAILFDVLRMMSVGTRRNQSETRKGRVVPAGRKIMSLMLCRVDLWRGRWSKGRFTPPTPFRRVAMKKRLRLVHDQPCLQ